MQYPTLASAIEAILNNQCSIKNDDVECLQRACKYVWPKDVEPGYGKFNYFFNSSGKYWGCADTNPCPNFITTTEFCRLMDEDNAKPIDLGKVFDENTFSLDSDGVLRVMRKEIFIMVVTQLLNEKSKS